MRAKEIIEGLPGATEAELDEIMSIIRGAKEKATSWREFEDTVNPQLERFRIKVDRSDPRLMGAPGAAFFDGIVIGHWGSWPQLRQVLSHELVHVRQIERAGAKGRAREMYQSSERKMLVRGKLDREAYANDPHELMAYGRSTIDKMRSQHFTRKQALDALRRTPFRTGQPVSAKSQKRFLKRTYQYAQELPEGRDDITKLPLPPKAKAYARRSGLAAMKRQPAQFIGVMAAVTNQRSRRRGFHNKDDGQNVRLTYESGAASVYTNAEAIAQRLLE